MKYFALFLFSLNLYAESYEVNRRGHIFIYEDSPTHSSLKSNKLNFEIPVKPCSQLLTQSVAAHFKGLLKVKTTGVENVIEVKSSQGKIHVPEGSENGRKLILFPDRFAKDFLVYKELCKEVKK